MSVSLTRRSLFGAFVLCLYNVAASGAPSKCGESRSNLLRPERHLILGVPFIGFQESVENLPQHPLTHPSHVAVQAMILSFWGKSTDLLKDPETARSWARVKTMDKAMRLDDVKHYIASDIPILVFQTTTPMAHFLSPNVAFVIDAATSGRLLKELDEKDLSSGSLGRMVSEGGFRQMVSAVPGPPRMKKGLNWAINMPAFLSARLLIGYDDKRKVVTLHDPTFGPALEMSYEDFETSWAPIDPNFQVFEPKEDERKPAPVAVPYRERNVDELAAQHLLYGYAYASVGKAAQAQEQYRKGLAIPGLKKEYTHLFLMESALLLRKEKRMDEAVEAARRCVELVPDNATGWLVLSLTYRDRGAPEDAQKATDAMRLAQEKGSGKGALARFQAVLPRNFGIARW